MKIKEVIDALEKFAPLPLQETFDNAGLQVGLTEAEVSGALLCLDVTEDVVAEAVALGCNLIVSHHPLLFRPLRRLGDETMVERCVRAAVKNDICLYAAHTNMDKAVDGVNFRIAEKLGLVDVQMIAPQMVDGVKSGLAVMGYLPVEEDSIQFLQRVKQALGCECLMHNEPLERPIQCVVVAGGAAADVLPDAIAQEADAFVTGEMSYHLYFGHEQQIQIAVAGHYESEQYTTEIFRDIIFDAFPELPVFITTHNTNPIKYS
ncbi:MAG: Nif3-like dinuclear metal center hexameric protein [Bacteroidaceae bacterium]|nr:Nif3-like dinuclear metal center hexameric protein [Bacteroidaceae bacterium]